MLEWSSPWQKGWERCGDNDDDEDDEVDGDKTDDESRTEAKVFEHIPKLCPYAPLEDDKDFPHVAHWTRRPCPTRTTLLSIDEARSVFDTIPIGEVIYHPFVDLSRLPELDWAVKLSGRWVIFTWNTIYSNWYLGERCCHQVTREWRVIIRPLRNMQQPQLEISREQMIEHVLVGGYLTYNFFIRGVNYDTWYHSNGMLSLILDWKDHGPTDYPGRRQHYPSEGAGPSR